jgi:hypothetical protein
LRLLFIDYETCLHFSLVFDFDNHTIFFHELNFNFNLIAMAETKSFDTVMILSAEAADLSSLVGFRIHLLSGQALFNNALFGAKSAKLVDSYSHNFTRVVQFPILNNRVQVLHFNSFLDPIIEFDANEASFANNSVH